MLPRAKARPLILIVGGFVWVGGVLILAQTRPQSSWASDFVQGLGLGMGLGLEVLGWLLFRRANQRPKHHDREEAGRP